MKKRVIERILIESAAAEGKCIAHQNGQAIFVGGVAPGDIVTIKITRKKKNFLEGKVLEFHEKSALRNNPFCSHFGLCGGCKWQHLGYQHQLHAKQQQILDNFERIGKFEFPPISDIIGAAKTQYYRNKLEYTFSNKRWLTQEEIDSGKEINRNGVGFHIPGQFDKIVDIQKCYLQREPSNDIRNALRAFAQKQNISFYDINSNKGVLRNLIVRTTSLDQLMIIVQFGEQNEEQIGQIMDFLNSSFPAINSLYYVVNLKRNETFHDQELILYEGEDCISEKIGGLTFKIGPKSFFQTNTDQTQKLYQKTKELARLSDNEIVYDLYTGTGTIACFVADQAQKVIGIENIDEAILDARKNAAANQIKNCTFITGDIKDTLTETLFAEHGTPDVIITDPPRAGMHPEVVQTLIKAAPRRIIYISCNPATQARDLAELTQQYEIDEIQPFDMFPHTHHLENIVSLKIKT